MLLLEPFQYDFMIRAFSAGLIIGVIAPLVGIFLVVRRYSLMADTLSHISLLGVAIGVIFKVFPYLSAILLSTIAAVGIEKLRTTRKIFGESVLSLFLSGSLALAIVIISLFPGTNINIYSYLFGSITTVTQEEIVVIFGFGVTIVLAVFIFFKELFFISFDEELARVNGLPVTLLNFGLVILAALTVSVAMRAVGILLIGALMVIPVVTAFQYARSFTQAVIVSVFFSLISVVMGLYLSYYYNVASGGMIVLIALAIFVLSLILPHPVHVGHRK
ncbi:metal ABC transporter permease [Candidatus Roizmanbacteria bacterium]|nr:metal ABC transporter permease [Candidatus Roizmanbacteria bacterium]